MDYGNSPQSYFLEQPHFERNVIHRNAVLIVFLHKRTTLLYDMFKDLLISIGQNKEQILVNKL